MAEADQLSRRGLFARFLRPLHAATHRASESRPKGENLYAYPYAVIQGRYCLANEEEGGCTVCLDNCPEAGAIVMNRGMPQVVRERCTGCGICHEVCPAPRNAILMIAPTDPSYYHRGKDVG